MGICSPPDINEPVQQVCVFENPAKAKSLIKSFRCSEFNNEWRSQAICEIYFIEYYSIDNPRTLMCTCIINGCILKGVNYIVEW